MASATQQAEATAEISSSGPLTPTSPRAFPSPKPALPGYARVDPLNKSQIALRTEPSYPGVRTDSAVSPGEVFEYSEILSVDHEVRPIKFFQLCDGRGWAHDFTSHTPKHPSIRILVLYPNNKLHLNSAYDVKTPRRRRAPRPMPQSPKSPIVNARQ